MNTWQKIKTGFDELVVDIKIGSTVASEVEADLKDITNPAAIAQAAANSIVKHAAELPAKWQGSKLVHLMTAFCAKVSGLDLDSIETIVNATLTAAGRPAAATA